MKKIKYLLFLFFIFSFSNVKALTLNQTKYEEYNIKRSYVLCDYIFDLSKYNPTLKDFLLAAQTCPTDNVTLYELKAYDDMNGEKVRSYSELLSRSRIATFPTLNVKYINTGPIGSSDSNTIDSSTSTITHNIDTINVNQDVYDKLKIERSYIVGAYIFDLSRYNPTLKDLLLANQTNPKGTAKIVEARLNTNSDGTVERSYVDLVSRSRLSTFPFFEGRYIFYSSIDTPTHQKESRHDLITGVTVDNAGSNEPTQEDPIDNSDPRNKEVNYKTKCMGYLTIPKVKDVVNSICIRWKDKSKNANAESNNVSTGIYTLPVSNYPNVKNGNLVLAAHSGTASISYFKTLWKLSEGDIATVKFNGNSYTYVIKKIYLVPKTGVVKITRNSSRTTLTLITCTKNDEAHQTVYILELRDIDGVAYN